MRGHEKIIEMRRAGKTPRHVFVNDYPCQTDWFETGEHATISVAGDDAALLDLRCLVNLTVHIIGSTEARAKSLAQRCKEFGAAIVAASHLRDDQQPHQQTGWFEVWRRTEQEAA